jgi:hypothetical protein
MKREYIGMLSMLVFLAVFFIGGYFFGEAIVMDNINRYIVVWLFLFYYIGQYSMRFPKRF